MEQSQLETVTLEVEYNGETHEADVTYSSWVARDERGDSFVNFEIYRIDCDVNLPETIVGAALADHITPIFSDEIC